jgi:hypothetical protein
MTEEYVQVYTANGQLQAEMIRIFLESKGIPAVAYGQSLASVYGLTVGPLSEVKIMVPETQVAEAHQVLADMEQGKYETTQIQPTNDDDSPNGEKDHPR